MAAIPVNGRAEIGAQDANAQPHAQAELAANPRYNPLVRQKPGDFRVYNECRGTTKLTKVHRDDKKEGVVTETLEERMIAVAEQMEEYVKDHYFDPDHRPDRVPMSLNLTDLYVTYEKLEIREDLNPEEPVTVHKHLTIRELDKIDDPELKALVREIYKLARKMEHDIYTSVDPNTHSNRPLHGNDPLHISNSERHQAHHGITADAFIAAHLPKFKEFLTTRGEPELAQTAEGKIRTTEYFIDHLKTQIEEQLIEEKANAERIKAHPDLADNERVAKRIKMLENLKAKLGDLDTFAIFTSVIFANERLGGFTSRREQFNRANLLKDAMHAQLLGAEEPYTSEAGDLLIHDRCDYHHRVNARGDEPKGVSVEEFVVHNFLNINNADFDTEESISSLGLPEIEKDLVNIPLLYTHNAMLDRFFPNH